MRNILHRPYCVNACSPGSGAVGALEDAMAWLEEVCHGLAGGGVPLPVEPESFSPVQLPAHPFCFLLVTEKR